VPCTPVRVLSRINSSLSFIPSRFERWGLTGFGLLFFAQGAAKAVDPNGYMASLDAFHQVQPAALSPLSLGALGLAWTLLELLGGVAMLYGGLARTPAKRLALGGVMLALGITAAYLSLDLGALAHHLATPSTTFGSYLAEPTSVLVVVQQATVFVTLAAVFTSVLRWPSVSATSAPRSRQPSHSQRRPSRISEHAA
jgi:hypothetical protein